jgi:Fur family zinc uptake transcriptional regulator
VGCFEEGLAEAGGHAHQHAAQFLICRACGQVTEIEDRALARALAAAARRVGFTVAGATIEADGQCATCAAAGSEAPAVTPRGSSAAR